MVHGEPDAMLDQPHDSSPPTYPPTAPPVGAALPSNVNSTKLAAGICAILLGGFGVHKFVLGYTGTGVLTLVISVVVCGLGYTVMQIIGIVEGILYLTKTDEQFYAEYMQQRKNWF